MSKIIGVVLIVTGIAVGLYLGVWWAFIGGIVDLITEIKSENLSVFGLACGVAKVFFSGAIGWLSALIIIAPGVAAWEYK